jgi:hypothetical protein
MIRKAAPPPKTLAVLPFMNLTADGGTGWSDRAWKGLRKEVHFRHY